MSCKPPRELQDLGFGIHLVPLTRGRFAIIDSADAPFIGQFNWQACDNDRNTYARRYVRVDEGRSDGPAVSMHSELLGSAPGQLVDHINRDGLDNRRSNLRHVDRSQNRLNSRLNRNNKSGFRYVYPSGRRWIVQVIVDGRQVTVGSFASAAEAYAARCAFLGQVEP